MKISFLKLKVVLFVFGFLSTTAVMAQSSLTIDASQQYSTFKFQDSQGVVDTSYLPAYTGAYHLGYRFTHESGLLVSAQLGMRKAGATIIYDDANYLWSLQYADFRLGAGYMLNAERFKPYVKVSGYYALLLKANQTQGTTNYDLVKAGELQRTDYGVLASPGLQVSLSEYISVYTEFSYLMGLRNMETQKVESVSSVQEGYNRAFSATLGLAFTIK